MARLAALADDRRRRHEPQLGDGDLERAAPAAGPTVARRDAQANLGAAYARLGRYEEAIGHYRTVLVAEPDQHPVRFNLGLALFKSARVGDAAEELARVLDLEGGYALLRHYASGGVDHPALTLAFGLSLLRVPRLPEEVRPEERERILLAGRAGLHMAQGSAGAMRAFEELVSRYPMAPQVHYAYGTYLLRAKPQAARAHFERELRRDPSHREARIQVALDTIKTGNTSEGERLAREVIGETPGFFAAHLALGRALLAQDRVEEAIAAREQAESRRLEALGRERGTLQLPE